MRRLHVTIDRTTLNIVTLVLAGVGIVGALSEAGVPPHDVHGTYFGSNPFALKRDITAGHLAFNFACLAGVGLFLQLAMEVFAWPKGEDRRRSHAYYIGVLLCMALLSWGLFIGIIHWSKANARAEWLPLLADTDTRKTFAYVTALVEKTEPPDMGAPPRTREQEASEILDNLERLFDITGGGSDLRARVARLSPILRTQ